MCAERFDVFKAISEGGTRFNEIYIATESDKFCPPCGACRQVLWELAGDIKIIMINNQREWKEQSLQSLLPDAFDKHFLEDL